MAYREVVLTEEEQKAGSGNRYRKFNALGDKHFGVFLGTKHETANFKDGPKDVTKYVFFAGKEGEFELTGSVDLDRKMTKAQKPVSEGGQGLVAWTGQGRPHVVRITFASTQPIEHRADPMKLFRVEVDTEPTIPAGTAIPVLRAPAAQQPQRAAQVQQRPPPIEEDIPF